MNNLLSVLQSQLGATEVSLCDLKSTCCSSEFKVIDFDEVKDAFCAAFMIPEHVKLASADGLYINEAKKRICFIEMKDVNKFLQRNLPSAAGETLDAASDTDVNDEQNTSDGNTTFDFKAFRKAFDLWLDEKNRGLRLKVADSIFITIAALTRYGPNPADVIEMLDKHKVEFKYVALLNVSSKYFIRYRLESLKINLAYGMLGGRQCTPAVIRASGFDNYAASELL
jgi:hypothetical protein